MTDHKRAEMLEKIRALLAKAEATQFADEAETFRAGAERLMLKYRIDVSQLGSEHEDNVPVGEDRDFAWYWNREGHRDETTSYLWMVMNSLARHCRVKVVTWRAGQRIPLVGLPSDIEYFDMLFTAAYLEFSKGLEPTPDPNKPMIENIVALKEAGQQWLRIAEQLHGIGQLTDEQFTPRQPGEYRSDYEARIKKQVHHLNFSGRYTKFCRDNDRQRLRVTPKIYQRSFAMGFESRMYDRLAEMRRNAMQQTRDAGESTGGMEIILADIYTRAEHKAIEIYGEPPESRRGRAGRSREVKVSTAAMKDGEARANRVDLGNTKRIGSDSGSLPR